MPVWRAAILVTAAVLAGVGSSACRTATPSVIDERPAVSARAPDVDPAPEPRLRTHLVIRVSERRLYLIDDAPDTRDESFPIAVGREGLETPIGQVHAPRLDAAS